MLTTGISFKNFKVKKKNIKVKKKLKIFDKEKNHIIINL